MTAQVSELDPDGSRDGPDPVPDPGEWLSVAEAARRLSVSEKAVRNRIRRGTIPWRAAGNHGREVLLTPDAEAGDGSEDGPGTVELQVRVARLEERLAVVERERDLYRDLFRDREAALAEARRPWLAKVIEGLRRKG
jgi:hypothetical protein